MVKKKRFPLLLILLLVPVLSAFLVPGPQAEAPDSFEGLITAFFTSQADGYNIYDGQGSDVTAQFCNDFLPLFKRQDFEGLARALLRISGTVASPMFQNVSSDQLTSTRQYTVMREIPGASSTGQIVFQTPEWSRSGLSILSNLGNSYGSAGVMYRQIDAPMTDASISADGQSVQFTASFSIVFHETGSFHVITLPISSGFTVTK